jgi:hypothetical protein
MQGFIPYFDFSEADRYSSYNQTSRGSGRRQHAVLESRNFMCAGIERNSMAMRRFIQYLQMHSSSVLALVRDAKTGNILVEPPRDQLWLIRTKSGLGRASRGEWDVVREVGPVFFKEMDELRHWHFGFPDYYDVYVWSTKPGEPFPVLYNTIQLVCIQPPQQLLITRL